MIDLRVDGCSHQIKCLYGPTGHRASEGETVGGAVCEPAVGVNNYNNLAWIRTEMADTPVESVPLAPFRGIVPLDHLGPRRPRHSSRVVQTVIRDHEQPVARERLALDVGECRQKSRAFIVRWHQHSNGRANAMIRRYEALPSWQCNRGNN